MFTNKHINDTIQEITFSDGNMYAQVKLTTIIKMKALIGLMFYQWALWSK